ncbi:MAG TPA: hypothetical protein PKZ16_01370 [bacterium]|nr:hypothetical protein [bacterium]HPL95203.1 hypothetical protein [bacterium]
MDNLFELFRAVGIAAAVVVAAVMPNRHKFQKIYKISWIILVICLIGTISIVVATFLATKMSKIIF